MSRRFFEVYGCRADRRHTARLSSLADHWNKQRFFVHAMAPRCPCLASASETDGARNAFSFFNSRVCVDKKFGRAQRQGLGVLG
jgi:hypothetical protein